MAVQSRQPVRDPASWEVDLALRELRAQGMPVALGNRAFEIVKVLVQSAGELVTKDDLMSRVWPGVIVEENTLHVHIAAIRKALGSDRALLKTISGRGYRLLGPWTIQEGSASEEQSTAELEATQVQRFQTNIPVAASNLIGRDAAAQHLHDLLSAYREVTLTGPAGIGKTTLALEVARALLPSFAGDGWLIELALLSDPRLVPSTVTSVLGLRLGGGDISAEAVARAIGARKLLLVLDNCEHVIDAAARLAETVTRLCPHATILATSREVLRVEGEYVYRVPPLEVPEQRQEPDNILEHGAVRLFVARATALVSDFSPDGEELAAICAICRHLDGIPLAIEFAAARAAIIGSQRVAELLDDRFALLTSGRRTALPRHRTLHAALDWSYDLLPEIERRLLRHLAVFVGPFALDGVAAVASGTGVPADRIAETISNLVAKSLLAFNGSATSSRWRLLETVRAFAREKLEESGELSAAARRHAEYHSDLFAKARSDWESQPTAGWLAEYGHRLDDLRASLEWAFSPVGDAALGITLTVDAVPLWMQRSLMSECRRSVERALSRVKVETNENARLRMRLWTALSLSRMYTGDPLSDIDAGWFATLDLAERLGDPDYQLRAIWGLFAGSFNSGNFRAALEFAERFSRVATDASVRLIGERLMGTALHVLGDQQNARRHIEHMLANYTPPVTSSHIIRYQNDQVIAAHRVLAPILWLQGYPDQAMRMVEAAVAEAVSLDHALTLCNMLAQAACPLAFLVGDLALAQRLTAMLIEYATQYSLDVWNLYGRCFEGLLLTRQGDFEDGLSRLRRASDDLRQAGFMQYYTPYLGLLAEALAAAGQVALGLTAIEETLARAESTGERWCLAELLRTKGGLLAQNAEEVSTAAAENCFDSALKVAREQGALSWELRAALSLARMRTAQDRREEARAILAPVYERFTEGFATADLRAAKALLDTGCR